MIGEKVKCSKGVLEQNSENNLKAKSGGNYKITVNFNKGTLLQLFKTIILYAKAVLLRTAFLYLNVHL